MFPSNGGGNSASSPSRYLCEVRVFRSRLPYYYGGRSFSGDLNKVTTRRFCGLRASCGKRYLQRRANGGTNIRVRSKNANDYGSRSRSKRYSRSGSRSKWRSLYMANYIMCRFVGVLTSVIIGNNSIFRKGLSFLFHEDKVVSGANYGVTRCTNSSGRA